MKAAQVNRYLKDAGKAIDNISVNEIGTPSVGEHDVRIRVKAAGVNPLDILTIIGSIKMVQDYAMPLTLGNECAGMVERIGSAVRDFHPGDRVMARLPFDRIGSFAEFAVAPADAVAPLPYGFDFAEAAAIPLSGLTAWQALDELGAKSGQSVLIPGGSGGLGRMLVPLAKARNLTVIVTGNARSREEILALGADRYLDYRREHYWEAGLEVDHVIDAIGPAEFDHELSVMRPGGVLVSLRGMPNKAFTERAGITGAKRLMFSLFSASYDRKARAKDVTYRFMMVQANGEQLRKVADIIRQGGAPTIDPNEFRLDDVRDALRLVNDGHPAGKVVIRI
ncbi:oxidoreductase [Bifidobacterium tissieri]|uniref:Oxidoreductase n=1 Tax=Bifidobacterium tissieri TaxID=1630162 RepID=A0A261FCS3_9BIFI|nr:NADP-dependent oxidoreductase [Bifidobacterium tissieri]OZG56908.1 oxidoreductase [Bifidobacterium tissieri]